MTDEAVQEQSSPASLAFQDAVAIARAIEVQFVLEMAIF
jgi:hypothetical protein